MAKFPIQRAPEKLGIVPTAAVRANIDVRTGGAELAEAVSGFGKSLFGEGLRYYGIQADTQLSEFQRSANEEINRLALSYDTNLDPETYLLEYKKSTDAIHSLMPKNRRAARAAQVWLDKKEPVWLNDVNKARLNRADDNWMAELFAKQVEVGKTGQIGTFPKFLAEGVKAGAIDKSDAVKVLSSTNKMAIVGQITNLYGAGEYDEARELAKTSELLTPRERESILNTIDTEERSLQVRAKEARQAIINKATSDTIREYFGGELTVSTLNQRHEAGLIKDSEFKFMMKGLTEATRTHSDPFAVGKIRRAETDLAMGAIDRAEADRIVLENYTKLDGADRSKVVADLEDVEAKIIAVAKSNAYDEGRGLMSQRFVGIQSEEDLIDLFRGAGLTEEEKKRINRRWTAEVNNRDLYERAVDERFVEMRKEGISASSKYKSESLEILLQYQRKKQLGLEELEAEVRREQQQRRPFIGPPTPVIKPVSEMTMEEKQRELERIRELKRR